MSDLTTPAEYRYAWMRQVALGTAFVWACWLTGLGLASGLRQSMSFGEVLLHTFFPGLVFLAGVFASWRWTALGGFVLILEGLISLFYFPFYIALPPITAGILLLAWKIKRSP